MIHTKLVEGADHFYTDHFLDIALEDVEQYLDETLDPQYCTPREPNLIGYED